MSDGGGGRNSTLTPAQQQMAAYQQALMMQQLQMQMQQGTRNQAQAAQMSSYVQYQQQYLQQQQQLRTMAAQAPQLAASSSLLASGSTNQQYLQQQQLLLAQQSPASSTLSIARPAAAQSAGGMHADACATAAQLAAAASVSAASGVESTPSSAVVYNCDRCGHLWENGIVHANFIQHRGSNSCMMNMKRQGGAAGGAAVTAAAHMHSSQFSSAGAPRPHAAGRSAASFITWAPADAAPSAVGAAAASSPTTTAAPGATAATASSAGSLDIRSLASLGPVAAAVIHAASEGTLGLALPEPEHINPKRLPKHVEVRHDVRISAATMAKQKHELSGHLSRVLQQVSTNGGDNSNARVAGNASTEALQPQVDFSPQRYDDPEQIVHAAAVAVGAGAGIVAGAQPQHPPTAEQITAKLRGGAVASGAIVSAPGQSHGPTPLELSLTPAIVQEWMVNRGLSDVAVAAMCSLKLKSLSLWLRGELVVNLPAAAEQAQALVQARLVQVLQASAGTGKQLTPEYIQQCAATVASSIGIVSVLVPISSIPIDKRSSILSAGHHVYLAPLPDGRDPATLLHPNTPARSIPPEFLAQDQSNRVPQGTVPIQVTNQAWKQYQKGHEEAFEVVGCVAAMIAEDAAMCAWEGNGGLRKWEEKNRVRGVGGGDGIAAADAAVGAADAAAFTVKLEPLHHSQQQHAVAGVVASAAASPSSPASSQVAGSPSARNVSSRPEPFKPRPIIAYDAWGQPVCGDGSVLRFASVSHADLALPSSTVAPVVVAPSAYASASASSPLVGGDVQEAYQLPRIHITGAPHCACDTNETCKGRPERTDLRFQPPTAAVASIGAEKVLLGAVTRLAAAIGISTTEVPAPSPATATIDQDGSAGATVVAASQIQAIVVDPSVYTIPDSIIMAAANRAAGVAVGAPSTPQASNQQQQQTPQRVLLPGHRPRGRPPKSSYVQLTQPTVPPPTAAGPGASSGGSAGASAGGAPSAAAALSMYASLRASPLELARDVRRVLDEFGHQAAAGDDSKFVDGLSVNLTQNDHTGTEQSSTVVVKIDRSSVYEPPVAPAASGAASTAASGPAAPAVTDATTEATAQPAVEAVPSSSVQPTLESFLPKPALDKHSVALVPVQVPPQHAASTSSAGAAAPAAAAAPASSSLAAILENGSSATTDSGSVLSSQAERGLMHFGAAEDRVREEFTSLLAQLKDVARLVGNSSSGGEPSATAAGAASSQTSTVNHVVPRVLINRTLLILTELVATVDACYAEAESNYKHVKYAKVKAHHAGNRAKSSHPHYTYEEIDDVGDDHANDNGNNGGGGGGDSASAAEQHVHTGGTATSAAAAKRGRQSKAHDLATEFEAAASGKLQLGKRARKATSRLTDGAEHENDAAETGAAGGGDGKRKRRKKDTGEEEDAGAGAAGAAAGSATDDQGDVAAAASAVAAEPDAGMSLPAVSPAASTTAPATGEGTDAQAVTASGVATCQGAPPPSSSYSPTAATAPSVVAPDAASVGTSAQAAPPPRTRISVSLSNGVRHPCPFDRGSGVGLLWHHRGLLWELMLETLLFLEFIVSKACAAQAEDVKQYANGLHGWAGNVASDVFDEVIGSITRHPASNLSSATGPVTAWAAAETAARLAAEAAADQQRAQQVAHVQALAAAGYDTRGYVFPPIEMPSTAQGTGPELSAEQLQALQGLATSVSATRARKNASLGQIPEVLKTFQQSLSRYAAYQLCFEQLQGLAWHLGGVLLRHRATVGVAAAPAATKGAAGTSSGDGAAPAQAPPSPSPSPASSSPPAVMIARLFEPWTELDPIFAASRHPSPVDVLMAMATLLRSAPSPLRLLLPAP